MDHSLLLSKQDVAGLFGVTPRTIEKWIASGALPRPRHMGRNPYWERESFHEWIRQEFRPVATAPAKPGRPRNRLGTTH
jgi:excisionase family DNA binding protein